VRDFVTIMPSFRPNFAYRQPNGLGITKARYFCLTQAGIGRNAILKYHAMQQQPHVKPSQIR
jgi:hypothetical protein